jgi:protein-S-isoprenylcysteine O-methyltransferase Ste14/membrane-associated phospholipid phosphatase
MGLSLTPLAGKVAYGGFFVVLAPLGLWVWSSRLTCPFPAFHSISIGIALLAAGGLLMVLAMWRLWREGGGLPMNAFPPPRVVTGGVYAWAPHPIYAGFVLGCAGAAIVSNSASALWIVTPAVALGCLSLVLGYEGPDLRRRFGSQLPEPWMGLPRGEGFLPLSRRVGTALAVFLPFAVFYLAVKAMGIPADAFETRWGWEWAVPVLPATMPVYASIYLVAPLTFFLCADRAEMRRLAVSGWMATGLNTLLYATVPATAAFRPVTGNDWMSQWLAWEQRMALPAAGSLPSFHVSWAVICAAFFARGPLRRQAAICWLWCAGLCVSCLTSGMHSLADVLAGAMTGAVCVRPERLWRRMLDGMERLGNQWKAWRFGPLRVINHGLWAGLAGFAVLLIAGMSAEAGQLGWVVLVASCALIGAGVFAQWVEGSPALLRPFGYYGAILGGLLALSIIALSHGPAAGVMAAFAVAAPWAVAVGRLRCVVQGCCHGRPVDWGMRVTNPHSRAVKLAGFSGTPIHPAPLYSILANIVIGLVLLRLRVRGAGPFQIAGLYLLLAGMARFVEEAYRGEPQTKRLAGLPLYQWLAAGSAALGMVVMALRGPALPPMGGPAGWLLASSALWAVVSAFAMSMDFPASERRFSRLTG